MWCSPMRCCRSTRRSPASIRPCFARATGSARHARRPSGACCCRSRRAALATAATFTFLLSLGFFVTPALLGGPSNTTIPMLINSFVNDRLDWPLAAAASMTLLAMALDGDRRCGAFRARWRAVGDVVTPAGAWTKAFAALLAALIVIPVLAVTPLAFSAQSFVRLPPQNWSLRWWGAFFADPSWLRALRDEPRGGDAAPACCRWRRELRRRSALPRLPRALGRSPTASFSGPWSRPLSSSAVGLYALARSLGLVGSMLGLVLAHTMLALPYVVMNVGVSIAALDPRLALGGERARRGPLARVSHRDPAVDPAWHDWRRRLRLRHLFRRGGAGGLPCRTQRQDAAGAHLGGSPRRIHAGRRGRRHDHDRPRRPRLGRRAVGDAEGTLSAVAFRGVTKRFDAFEALSPLDLDIASGEFVSFLGPSGSGKTTLLNICAGYIAPTAGSLFDRRARRHRPAGPPPQYRDGVPELCAVSASQRLRKRRLRIARRRVAPAEL